MAPATRKNKKPLSERNEKSLQRWIMNELQAIGLSDEIGHHFPTEFDRKARLGETIQTLQDAFPERIFNLPSGDTWTGTALPDAIRLGSLKNDDNWSMGGTLFQNAIRLNHENEAQFIPWFIASGFDPTAYNPHTKNAPLGQMAYTGRYAALAVCREAGTDMNLLVEAHHYPKINPKQPGTIVGTTLLHRVARRYNNLPFGQQVMKELLLAGLDPHAETVVGESVLAWSQGEATNILNKWIANQEALALQDTTTPTSLVRNGYRL